MNGAFLSFFVEIFVAFLLMATIVYCLIVNRKLDKLRGEQKNLKNIIRDLNQSTLHAENAIGELRVTVDRASQDLGERIDQAERLSSKMQNQTETSESLLNKLTAIGRATQNKMKSNQMKQRAPLQSSETSNAFNTNLNDLNRPLGGITETTQDYSPTNNQGFQPAPRPVQSNNSFLTQDVNHQNHQQPQRPEATAPTQNFTSQPRRERAFPRLRLSALSEQGLPEPGQSYENDTNTNYEGPHTSDKETFYS